MIGDSFLHAVRVWFAMLSSAGLCRVCDISRVFDSVHNSCMWCGALVAFAACLALVYWTTNGNVIVLLVWLFTTLAYSPVPGAMDPTA